ncbi:MAG: class I SAM-dependent methyltransferase [Candidatus Hodarchaeota archaeon]
MLTKIVKIFSELSRKRRSIIFKDYMQPNENNRILDLGSEDGSHIAQFIPFRKEVYIADIDEKLLEKGRKKFGFKTILINESGRLPFDDKFFDIVYCNSVIEHVGVQKSKRWDIVNGEEFSRKSFEGQQKFANEIKRVSKKYFVQTPNKYFFIESHTWLPLIQFLPRRLQVSFIKWLNKWWIKKTTPDWHLLNANQLQELFPDSKIVKEKIGFICKSLIAIKN